MLYHDCGENCEHHAIELAAGDGYRFILDKFLADVHSGKLAADSIQADYYANLAAELTKAVAEGLGGTAFKSADYRNSLKAYLDQNIYAFSGAKSLTMLKQFNALLLDEKGEILPFAQFKAKALQVDTLYNKTYLQAEYETAIACAQMAESWQGLKGFKLLEFSTSGGETVCPICGGFDRMIFATNDPRLNRVCPPLHYKCKCKLIPAADSDTPTDRDHAKAIEKAANIQPYFKNNPGKSKVIYAGSHPYFKMGTGKLKELDAEKNYGMPSVEKIYVNANKLPAINYTADKETALAWWNKMAGEKKGSFELQAADGLSITFDNSFRNHVLESNKDDRWKIINKLHDVVKSPDEIWTRRDGDNISVSYLKYYNEAPIVMHVTAGDRVRADTFFEVTQKGKLNTQELIKIRHGQLKFKQ